MPAPSRPLARLAAAAMLAAFLVAQSWIVCAPLCLLEGHAEVAMSLSPGQSHGLHCHSDKTLHRELPVVQSLGVMLPVAVTQLLSPPPVVTSQFAPPVLVHLQQIPLAEPPPPRSV